MIDQLKNLESRLITAEANFRTLHWKSIGRAFDKQHTVASDLIDMVEECIDGVAELILRVSTSVPNVPISTMLISQEDNYTYNTFVSVVSRELNACITAIAVVLSVPEVQNDVRNTAIKADLESMFSKVDLQLRYLNNRRIQEGNVL